jgi:chemotaxis protein MotB
MGVPQVCLGVFVVAFVLLGIAPNDRPTWALESSLSVLAVLVAVATFRRFRFRDRTYVAATIFLLLHTLGSHYTYSATPVGALVSALFGATRNHYDRFVHFMFGVLAAGGLRELAFAPPAIVPRTRQYLLVVSLIGMLGGLYEIVEWLTAVFVDPAAGTAFLGTQGDDWDAQKDLALACAGGAVGSALDAALAGRLQWGRRRKGRPMKLAALASVVLLVGCVSQGRYDQAVSRTNLTRAELAQKSETLDKTSTELEARRDQVARLRAELLMERDARANEKWKFRQYAREIEREADAAEADRNIAEARAEEYRELLLRLTGPIDEGDLDVVVRDGRMIVRLSEDVLFDSGKTEIKTRGAAALAALAKALAATTNRDFQIAGHTDTVPIATDRFPSNWELSMARALRVLRFLEAKGVPRDRLSAAAYADVDPIAPNDHAEGRRRNRRIEITVMPHVEDMDTLP